MSERFIVGEATQEELRMAGYYAEGVAYGIDANLEPEMIKTAVQCIEAIPTKKLTAMFHPRGIPTDLDALGLLLAAAYFVNHAVNCCPPCIGQGPPNALFLSADLLRKVVDYPFR